MSEIPLTGLKANVPIGAMASFGLLRVCSMLPRLGEVRLHWRQHGGAYHSVLTSAVDDKNELVLALVDHIKSMGKRTEFTWAEQIKSAAKEQFIEAAEGALRKATPGDHIQADWFACFGNELVLEKEKLLETPFDMSVARQRFLADSEWLTEALAQEDKKRKMQPSTDSFQEALFGPWKYNDDQHHLGWDPCTMLMGAFTYRAPTNMKKAGVRAAVWLAIEALPLFPCFYARGGLRTRAFTSAKKDAEFCWPVWSSPISVRTLKSLLCLSALIRDPIRTEELRSRGIEALYRSRCFKPNKYLASFQPAVLCG